MHCFKLFIVLVFMCIHQSAFSAALSVKEEADEYDNHFRTECIKIYNDHRKLLSSEIVGVKGFVRNRTFKFFFAAVNDDLLDVFNKKSDSVTSMQELELLKSKGMRLIDEFKNLVETHETLDAQWQEESAKGITIHESKVYRMSVEKLTTFFYITVPEILQSK